MSGSMTQTDAKPAYVVWDLATNTGATIRDERFVHFTERHHYRPNGTLQLVSGGSFDGEVGKTKPEGVVLVVHTGVPGNVLINAGKSALGRGLKAYYFWPHEEAVEVIDHERLRSFRKLWLMQRVYARMRKNKRKLVQTMPADPVAAAQIVRRHITAEEILAQAKQIPGETSLHRPTLRRASSGSIRLVWGWSGRVAHRSTQSRGQETQPASQRPSVRSRNIFAE